MYEDRFKITDEETANTIGFFDAREVAEARLRYLAKTYPERARFLLLVSMDKEGRPLQAQGIEQVLQSA